jgi:GT2 family glycosyltransferase
LTHASKRFAVVVAAHRTYDTLELCLRGFHRIVAEPTDLIFVDNGSGGSFSDLISRDAPGTTLITLRENRSFCGGYNTGVRWALDRGYEYVLIVNADTEVANPAFIGTLIDAMEHHPNAAFVGPLVYYRSVHAVQTTCLTFPNILRSILVWLPFRLLPGLVTWQSRKEREVDFLNGVCVLCRAEALREIGLLDESFQAYVEDADWSWRARAKGWRSLFVPVPSVIHHEEPYGYEHYSSKTLLLKRNTVRWFLKAGKFYSARIYAITSLKLARLRTLLSRNTSERNDFLRFSADLDSAYQQLWSTELPDCTHNAQTHHTTARPLSVPGRRGQLD